MLWLLPIIFACSTDSPESVPAISTEDGAPIPDAKEYEGLPVLTVHAPSRAVFDTSGSGAIEGRVATGDATIETLTINGEQVDVDNDGSFRLPMGWKPGIQLIGTRIESSNGERAVDGRAFHAGPVHDPGDWIEGAVRMEIDAEILDDDDAVPDDIAGLVELALEDASLIESMIGTPIDMVDAIITPLYVDYGRARVDLAPLDGALNGVVSIDAVDIEFQLDGVGLFSWFSTTGAITASVVDVGLSLTVESADGQVRCEASELNVTIDGLAYDIDYVPEFLEDFTSGMASNFIESSIGDMVRDQLVPEVEDLLSGFAVGASFDVDLSFDMRLAEISVVEEGVRFEVDARIQAIDGMALPPRAGSMDTDGDAPDWPTDKLQPFWAVVDDDLMNQLSFAFWQTGMLKDVEFDGALLALVSGAPLPEPLGPAETVSMTLNLPPVMTHTEQEGWAAQVAVGEWEIGFHREDGEVLRFSVSARSHFQTEVGEEGKLEFAVDSRPSNIEQVVGVLEAPEALDPGDLSALIRLLIPPLLGNADLFVRDLPIPEIALDEFLSVPETEGKVVRVSESSVRLEEDGWLLVEAGLEVY